MSVSKSAKHLFAACLTLLPATGQASHFSQPSLDAQEINVQDSFIHACLGSEYTPAAAISTKYSRDFAKVFTYAHLNERENKAQQSQPQEIYDRYNELFALLLGDEIGETDFFLARYDFSFFNETIEHMSKEKLVGCFIDDEAQDTELSIRRSFPNITDEEISAHRGFIKLMAENVFLSNVAKALQNNGTQEFFQNRAKQVFHHMIKNIRESRESSPEPTDPPTYQREGRSPHLAIA